MRLSPPGEAGHRGGSGHLGKFCFNLLPPHWSATLYSHLLNNFSFSLYKKTTKSWLIISNSVHPIMIQWIIYFSKLNHSRSHFLPCRQKPLYFTHGYQLVFIEVFKIYLNTEKFKKSCFIFLSQLLSWYPFCPHFQKLPFWRQRNTSILWLCFVTGHGGGVSWVLLWNWCLFWIYLCLFLCHHLRVHLYTCMSHFSPKRCQQINKKELSRLLTIYLFMPYPLPITYSSTLNWWR